MEKPIICTANQNGSQADCELGNPFKRDSEVPTCPNVHVFILTLSCCPSNVRDVLTFSFLFFLNQTTFYIILSTVGMSLDTTEIDIDLQLQT